jgi:hypothetical protein
MSAVYDPVKDKWYDSKTGKQVKNPNAGKTIDYYADLANIDTIFETDQELRRLLETAVKEGWEASLFQQKLESTTWAKKNATDIRSRDFERRQFDELVAAGQDTSKTTYGRGVEELKNVLRQTLTSKGLGYSEGDLTRYATEIYSVGREQDSAYINAYFNKAITFTGKDQQRGKGADYLQQLQEYGLDFGVDIQKDFGTSTVSDWLQRLDRGENIQAVKNQIKTAAMVGQPESVKKLVDQGLTLKNVYDPYVNKLNTKLQKTDITMKDPWLQKNAFNDKGELRTLWEMDIAANNHPDWQFTDEANQKFGDTTLRILRDFGYQG